MSEKAVQGDGSSRRIGEVLRRYWGYSELRPLQEEAIRAGLDGRDSLVVLPTGGGKSLCYQVPPVLAERTDIVVSPLISLMKDQVDALRSCDYPALALHSGLSLAEQRRAEAVIVSGRCRLLFAAPERLLRPRCLDLLGKIKVGALAIDEAHCISHWGHDFRPEYRRLAELREHLGGCSVHAYTATATERVRRDIVDQLRLRDPAVLVGVFDRPNLIYRILPRSDVKRQVADVLARHRGDAAIVYCLSRSDTEDMAEELRTRGVRAAHYHAGLEAEHRRRTQDDFAHERVDVVVATVAFGMGIDRSDVRCVIHASMPKSVEHYQQETGRAGRDGLEAECVLFYSAADVLRWESILRNSAAEETPEEVQAAAEQLLQHMRRYCSGVCCRHRALSEYFGQGYGKADCKACDVCLDEVEGIAGATVIAQKILSCVARTGESFGVGYVAEVLLGAETERVRRFAHHRLSTYGLLRETPRKSLYSMIYQLIDQGVLDRSEGDRPVLRLNADSWAVMRGRRGVRLVQAREKVQRTKVEEDSWKGVDRALFERLRELRREVAVERQVPAFVVFSDRTLRDLARLRPRSPDAFLRAHGVGEKKLAEFADRFLACVGGYLDEQGQGDDQR